MTAYRKAIRGLVSLARPRQERCGPFARKVVGAPRRHILLRHPYVSLLRWGLKQRQKDLSKEGERTTAVITELAAFRYCERCYKRE